MSWWFATYCLGYGAWVVWLQDWARRSVWFASPVLTWGLGLVGALAWPVIALVVLVVRARDAHRG